LITDKDHVSTHALVSEDISDQRVIVKYICGETAMETTNPIDRYFSGKKNRLVIESKESEDFFELSKVRNVEETV
jgi:hypothetical protein